MKFVVKSLVIGRLGLDGGLRKPIWGPPRRGPPGAGGKVKFVVKGLVLEWPGLDGGLRRPILGASGRGPPESGGKVKLAVKSLGIEWRGLDGGLWRPISGPPGRGLSSRIRVLNGVWWTQHTQRARLDEAGLISDL